MATIRLVPSVLYNAAGTSYLTVSNESNAFTNCDSDTYCTVQNIQSSTSNRYVYLRGFNFDDIPSNAIINSFTVKIKAYESGISTSSSYRPYLANGTATLTGTCDVISTSATVHTFTGVTADWEDLVGYGSNFGIRVNCRRASRNTTGYMYIYGAEIEVDYTIPVSATVTSTLSGNGTINPSGAYSCYEGDEYTLTITPTDTSDTVTVTNNGTDVTSDLVGHGAETTISAVPQSVTTSGISSGSSYMEYAVGCSAENPSSSGTSSNAYASSGSTGYAEYSFDFSDIPSGATIESVSGSVYGHRESSTTDSTHISQVQLYSGSTAKGEAEDFTSTSNQTITISDAGTWTWAELQSAKLRHTVGYYGGLVLGISFEVTYSTGGGITHYTYTYTVTGDATIAVVISGSASGTTLYKKENGAWVEVGTLYQKVNGTWQAVSDADIDTVLSAIQHLLQG